MPDQPLNATAASILGFLRDGPMTGWDLDQCIEGSVGNFWNVTRSQIYRELRTLTELGYVEVGEPGPRDRTPHKLTAAGREAFMEWINRDPGPTLIRAPLLISVFFGDALDEERLAEIVADARRHHEAVLASYRQLEPFAEATPFPAHTLRFGIAYEEALLEWLDSLPWGQPAATDEGRRSGDHRGRRGAPRPRAGAAPRTA